VNGHRGRRLAAVALGSNLGERRVHLDFAIGRLAGVLDELRVSPFVETVPVGVGQQPTFLNGAAVGSTCLPARRLLELLQSIERERGRERPYPGAPRTLDLDLILLGDLVVYEPGLVVPHPRFRERRFVLEPLAAIAPEFSDPVTGFTLAQLLAQL